MRAAGWRRKCSSAATKATGHLGCINASGAKVGITAEEEDKMKKLESMVHMAVKGGVYCESCGRVAEKRVGSWALWYINPDRCSVSAVEGDPEHEGETKS